jgi:AcrR family transcriptional regulator
MHNQIARRHPGPTVSERIIHAATALFSRQGYYKTGTKEIARLADISEVTLFRHFEHKEEIFSAALNSSYQSVESRLKMFSRGLDGCAPEEVLPKIIRLLVDITIFSPELLKLVMVAALELRGKYHDMCCRLLAPLLTAITSYLKLNIQIGRIRDVNPAIVTAAMALSIIVQPEISCFIEGCGISEMNGRDMLEEYSSFWMKVLISPAPETTIKPVVQADSLH